jgi:GNAT superfamily N-acetyltransferase
MTTALIRPFAEKDIEPAARLHHYIWNDYYSTHIPAAYAGHSYSMAKCLEKYRALFSAASASPAAHHVMVAEMPAGDMAAVCTLSKNSGSEGDALGIDGYDTELDTIYLYPLARGQGLGRRMLAAAVPWFKAYGYSSAFAWSLDFNPASAFYIKNDALPFTTIEYNYAGTVLPVTAYGWISFPHSFERI